MGKDIMLPVEALLASSQKRYATILQASENDDIESMRVELDEIRRERDQAEMISKDLRDCEEHERYPEPCLQPLQDPQVCLSYQ